MSENEHLTHPAAALARMAPQQWEEFKKAFRAYESEALGSLMLAQLDALPRMQGMALQCATLATIFDSAIQDSDRMVARRQNLKARQG